MVEMRQRLRRAEPYIVATLALAYFVLYSVLSVLRHTTYHSFGPDLGIFDQVFWNTTHGRFFESTMSLSQPEPHSYLADHFSPAYLLLMPAYALIPRPPVCVRAVRCVVWRVPRDCSGPRQRCGPALAATTPAARAEASAR